MSAASGPLRILLVEDNNLDRDLLVEVLDAPGYRVRTAENGREALAAAGAGGVFDLIISDLNMPEMGGLELIERLRAVDPVTPVIILTGIDETRVAVEALKKGANDYLVKDAHMAKTLTVSIESVMESHRLKLENLRLAEELARHERSLEEKVRELEVLNRSMNEIVGIAAHDLRTPLSVIEIYASFLEGKAAGRLTEEELQFLGAIQKSSKFMLQLINDLLDLSKIESGSLELRIAAGDYPEFLRRNAALNAAIASARGIGIEVLPAEAPLEALFDPGKIEQVLNNLFGNAIKFSAPGSRITVTAERVDGSVVTRIADAGPGIPAGELATIFEPFHEGTLRPPGGEKSTGLGLAIVRKIVERHGGTVGVASTIGKGSTFSFSLPLAGTGKEDGGGAGLLPVERTRRG